MDKQEVNFLYNKKSPIFLVEIATLIMTLVIRTYPSPGQLFSSFTLVIIIGCITEILFKSLGVWLLTVCETRSEHNQDTASTKFSASKIEGIGIILFLLYHAVIWVYAVVLFNNAEYRGQYRGIEPQWAYLTCYVWVYGVVLVGSMLLFLIILGVGIVAAVIKRKKNKSQAESLN